jgi:Flp pilus assembly pilin Flp
VLSPACEKGLSRVEYALVLILIAILVIATLVLVGYLITIILR